MLFAYKHAAKLCTSSMSTLVKSEVRPLAGVSKGGVGVITLADPSKLNALTVEMGKQFTDAVKTMKQRARDQEIRACIVTGEGEAFSAGGDLAWLKERHNTAPYLNSLIMVDFYNAFLCVREIGVPTIAAINGAAIGAGLCMTLACDVRVGLSTAKLGFTFPKLGIHPGMGASVLLPRLVSQGTAAHLLLSGDIFKGKEAWELGLLIKSEETKEQVFQTALDLAKDYARNSPIAVLSAMRTLRLQKFEGLDAGLAREADAQAECYASQDFLKGLNAVKTKAADAGFQGW